MWQKESHVVCRSTFKRWLQCKNDFTNRGRGPKLAKIGIIKQIKCLTSGAIKIFGVVWQIITSKTSIFPDWPFDSTQNPYCAWNTELAYYLWVKLESTGPRQVNNWVKDPECFKPLSNISLDFLNKKSSFKYTPFLFQNFDDDPLLPWEYLQSIIYTLIIIFTLYSES